MHWQLVNRRWKPELVEHLFHFLGHSMVVEKLFIESGVFYEGLQYGHYIQKTHQSQSQIFTLSLYTCAVLNHLLEVRTVLMLGLSQVKSGSGS